ncbi:MAG: valine--tRNA ligase [Phycisphaerales bacterium]
MMLADLAKSYAPAESEQEIRDRWENAGVFHAEPDDPGDPYCILIPPPNVTAALHLGHAFNNTLQDLLIRYHRMRGCNTLWMPGTDHAGIATQTVVEKRLAQQGIRRVDLGRDAFVEKVQAWKDEYQATILEQLKAIGCSCDWPRVRFTMDPMCTRAVREAFYRLFADGLIYRGKYLVNWDPVTLTALADDEVEMKEIDGHMWYLRYPLVPTGDVAADHPDNTAGDEFVVVATTRPETMLGDTAVAMNPRDPNATTLIGRNIRLPLVNRIVPIVADDYVVMPDEPDNPMARYATGYLKVTPAHDPNDWEIGQRHGLAVINVMAPDATISRDHGWPAEEFESGQAAEAEPLLGLSREAARERVVQWFRQHDLLADVRDYRHSVGHSYRSHVPIEPYLSDQWYVRVTDQRLSGEALRALCPDQHEGPHPPRADGSPRTGDGDLRFFPARYARTFQSWHENLRDWCISRQLWWGHRIPIWTLQAPDGQTVDVDRWKAFETTHTGRVAGLYEDGCVRFCPAAEAGDIERELEAAGFVQDPDVLDTWFSSGLWPLSTMGWPGPDQTSQTAGLLDRFNPSSVLCTARDIITLWVSRMVMFNRYFRDGTLPFTQVYVHPMIQDGVGQRMSKSLGNGVDPRDIIHSHGTDALRFVLTQIATSTQDVRLPVDMLCPHCEQTFEPNQITNDAGYRVAAPTQVCPKCKGVMLSATAAALGDVKPDHQTPTARNSSRKFDLGRNFANKFWNATRFALAKLDGDEAISLSGDVGELSLIDRWIIGRLQHTLGVVEDAVAGYQFHQYAEAMYDFIWRDFCDWYLEAVKPTVGDDPSQRQVLRTVLNATVRMLHPICPFVTETLWPHIQAAGAPGLPGVTLDAGSRPDLLATAPWPRIAGGIDEQVSATVERIQTLTMAIRNLRAEHKVSPKKRIKLFAGGPTLALIESGGGIVQTMAGLSSVEPVHDGATPDGTIPLAIEGDQVFVGGLVEAVDVDAEQARLTRVCQEKEKAVVRYRSKLQNKGYINKAPAALVDQTREMLSEAEADLAASRKALQLLQGD